MNPPPLILRSWDLACYFFSQGKDVSSLPKWELLVGGRPEALALFGVYLMPEFDI